MSATPQDRYQFKPFPGSSHLWALAKLSTLPRGARVLDIGPGSGFTGNALRTQGVDAIYAVEIDPDARAHLRPIYRQVEADLEPYRAAGAAFDAILLLDVLEHMADPFGFMDTVLPLLRPEGMLLVSVPNVAHWSVRIPLLFGFFECTERGILDKTHLQFFTRRRFRTLLARPDLEVLELNASISPAELALPEWLSNTALFRIVSAIRLCGARAWPGPFAYQHLGLARKR